MDRRMLFFSFMIAPWMLCVTTQNDQTELKNSGFLIVDFDDWQSKDSVLMEAKKKKEKVIAVSDYESIDNTGEEGSAVEKKEDLPTCLLCVCLSGSVYCEEISPEMTKIPALPRETAYLYARFNKIARITSSDFSDVATLKRIDLTGNLISEIEDGAFSKLTHLEELILAENGLFRLPMLPSNLVLLNVNSNKLRTKGVRATVLKKLKKLAYLYLGDNELEAVPPLPETLHVVHLHNNNITSLTAETFCRSNDTHYIRYKMQEVRLDGNPVIFSQHPNIFICLRSLPIGLYK